MTANSDKSGLFIYAWRALAPDDVQAAIEWIPEYAFNKPHTKHRFDWALPDRKIALEVDGANRMVRWSEKAQKHVAVGAHTQDKDYDKLNHAAAYGWIVFRFSVQQLETDPAACIALVLRALGMGEGDNE